MLNGQKIIVIMPAYNAEATLRKTHEEVMAQGIVDWFVVVDDASNDRTMEIASSLPVTVVHRHEKNLGYGGNQKTSSLQCGKEDSIKHQRLLATSFEKYPFGR